ncbi:MAG: hypothetical protein ACHQET_03065 [Chitinophagales bacterium]
MNELQLLEKKIKDMQLHAKELERQIDEKLNYFHDNYRSLAIKSLLPAVLAKSGLTSTLLEVFLENKQLRNSVNKMADRLFNKISEAVEYLSRKFTSKSAKRIKPSE